MAKRKFQMYLIQITYSNGDVENIEYNTDFKQVNKTSYKEMLEVYKEIKEQFSEVSCTIDFIGTNQNEQMIIFRKVNEIESTSHEESVEENIIDLFEDLNGLLKRIREKKETLTSEIKTSDLAISYIYHADIENCDNPTERHMIDTFKKLKSAHDKRREVKHQQAFLEILKSNDVNIGGILGNVENIDSCLIKIENGRNKSLEAINNYASNESEQLSIASATYYKCENFKQKMNLMKQLQPKYKHIVYDEVNKQLICRDKKK